MNPKINQAIGASSVTLIGEENESLGVCSLDQALFLASEKNIDLIEISPSSNPPVAKLMDFGKYQYEQQKKLAKRKSHQKTSELKEIRLTLKINQHDLETKTRQSKNFLDDGNKIKMTVILKGRENIYPQKANELINKFCLLVNAKVDQPPSRLGNRIATIISRNK